MQLNSCSLCGLQYQPHLTFPFDIPVYQSQTDSLKIINRKICKPCSLILTNIQSFAEHNQIRFGNHNFKSHVFDYYSVDHAPQPKRSVQLLYETACQTLQKRGSYNENRPLLNKRLSMTERSYSEEAPDELMHPYITLLIDEILQKNYLTLAHFSKTLQLLAYLSGLPSQKDVKSPLLFVLSEERHEKIKNIILYLAEKIHLSLEQLPYVLFLANFLLCLMNPPKVVSVIVQLSNLIIAHPQLINWKSLIFEQERSHLQTPLSPATIDLKAILVQVDKLWLKIESIIDLSRRGEAVLREGLIRISKLDLNCDAKEFKKKLGEGMKSMLSKRQDLDALEDYHLSMLYLMKLERNSFNLILRQALQEEEQARLQIVQLHHKFKMEKDEFIEKIIKLNNKIESLEKSLKQLEESSSHISEKIEPIEEIAEVILVQEEAHPLQIQLESIITVTDLFNFNEKHYIPHAKEKHQESSAHTLPQKIIVEIQKMQETIERNIGRVKFIEEEKSRLLGIISRKQERLLSVILDKDTTIERYEQALWTMENGLEVTQGPLANRIKYIMHIFANRKRSESMDVIEVLGEATAKKVKDKDKDCQIY